MLEDKEQFLHIPSYVLNDVNLDSTKKILFSYILSLSKTPKGCYSSNKDFGKKLGINPDGASKQISKLKKIGYIATRYIDGYRFIELLNWLSLSWPHHQAGCKNNEQAGSFDICHRHYLAFFNVGRGLKTINLFDWLYWHYELLCLWETIFYAIGRPQAKTFRTLGV